MNASAPNFTNQLIQETSPYLLQHAHNPVAWMPWSDSIFTLAQTQNKPILLSIGYAACHWCHVMERESFESETVAEYMNAHFINVKVDREERPDVDHIYMDALQAMTGSGGWPLNIFLLPDGKPFYGGTYFPPIAMQNRASWMDVLKGVKEAFENNKDKLIEQANQLTNHIVQTNIKQVAAHNSVAETTPLATTEEIDLIGQRIMQGADTEWGGFGKAPKFPQTFAIQMLLRHYYLFKDPMYLNQAVLSLDKMIQGGIYDHLGGGFARYSTDGHWQAPHFEKMLYDNALLISVLSEAYQITQKEDYKAVILQTFGFLQRALSNGHGAFYAALDADSEGVEGKYYTWSFDELKQFVPENLFAEFCDYYQIKENGNWEHTNILWTTQEYALSVVPEFEAIKNKLLAAREKRIKPALDYKIILSWNNLTVTALCKSYSAIGDESLKQQAIQAMEWIEKNMLNVAGSYFYHTNTKGQNKTAAFLDDYASLIQAYILLQEITGNAEYLLKAKQWTEYVQTHFMDEEKVFFYYTAAYQKDVIVRKKENYDGAQPSGNSLMCYNLLYLSVQFDLATWANQAHAMIHSMRKMILQYPSSFSVWAQCFCLMSEGFTELVGIGPTAPNAISQVNKPFLPFKMTLFLSKTNPILALTKGRESLENQYYICKNGTCSAPVSNLDDYLALI